MVTRPWRGCTHVRSLRHQHAIEQPRSISLTLNMSAAKALGIRVPPALIVRADRVIE